MFAFALSALAFYLAIVFHELGHAVAANIAGFRLLSFSFWPICVRRTKERWHFVRPPLTPLEALGFVQFVPCHARQLRARVAWIIGGGPAVSIFVSALAAGIANSRIARLDSNLSLLAWGLSFWSAVAGLSSLIPITTGTMATDGKKLIELCRGERSLLRWYAVSGLLDAASRVRPQDWDPQLVALAVDSSVELRTPDQNLTTLRLNNTELSPSQHALESAVQRLRFFWGLATSNPKESARGFAWLYRHRAGRGGPDFFRAALIGYARKTKSAGGLARTD